MFHHGEHLTLSTDMLLLFEIDNALLTHNLHTIIQSRLAMATQFRHSKSACANPRQNVVLRQLSMSLVGSFIFITVCLLQLMNSFLPNRLAQPSHLLTQLANVIQLARVLLNAAVDEAIQLL